jgi:hypothetical protein
LSPTQSTDIYYGFTALFHVSALAQENDYWYSVPGAVGGTHGVMWTMLNDKWATSSENPYINATLFGKVPGYPTNYYSFKAVSGLVSRRLVSLSVDMSRRPSP